MPRGSAPGERRGGRQKGTPNRPASVRAFLDGAGVNPVERLIILAQRAESAGQIALAADIWSKLATLAYPSPQPAPPPAISDLQDSL